MIPKEGHVLKALQGCNYTIKIFIDDSSEVILNKWPALSRVRQGLSDTSMEAVRVVRVSTVGKDLSVCVTAALAGEAVTDGSEQTVGESASPLTTLTHTFFSRQLWVSTAQRGC